MRDLVQSVTTLPETIRFGGHTIRAPGFDELTFAAAVNRAFSDGLAVSPGRAPRSWYVRNPVSGQEYVASLDGTCTCAAGHHRSLCKHLALTLLLDAILTPVDRLGGVAP